jgi:hypothetical protein
MEVTNAGARVLPTLRKTLAAKQHLLLHQEPLAVAEWLILELYKK